MSLGFFIAGRVSFIRAFLYTLCQVLGAAVGAALIRAVSFFVTVSCGHFNTLCPRIQEAPIQQSSDAGCCYLGASDICALGHFNGHQLLKIIDSKSPAGGE